MKSALGPKSSALLFFGNEQEIQRAIDAAFQQSFTHSHVCHVYIKLPTGEVSIVTSEVDTRSQLVVWYTDDAAASTLAATIGRRLSNAGLVAADPTKADLG